MSNTRRRPVSRGLALTDKTTDEPSESLVRNDIRSLGILLAVGVLAVAAVAFYAKADLSCSGKSEQDPMIGGAILISGCDPRVASDAQE
jgi:hypothetical protein